MTLAQRILAIELTGTDKQIVWARSLRQRKIEAFQKMGNRAVLRHLRPLLVEAELRVMNAYTPEKLGLLATLTVIQACSNPEARFWIDRRDDDPVQWLRPAYGEVLLHYLHHPFSDEPI